ncbi:MFS transporter [Methanobacterium oryzae]|uniref:MFS transporter n=1 Tax=Methanobacterium oryzae TaxID=69540 RepID=UPI003D2466E3
MNNLKNTVLITVVLGSFLIPFMGTSLNIALPSIGAEFTLNAILLSWIPTVFILANAALILPFGRLADIKGRKKIFLYGVITYTFASFLAAISPSGILLLIFSFLQGIGCSMIFGTGVALISSVFQPKERGRAYGIYVASVYTGIFSGLILGGFLIQELGWRSIFLFNIPFGVLLILIVLFELKSDWSGSEGEKFDFIGSILFFFIIIALMQGFSSLTTNLGKFLILAGLLGIFIFLKYENKIKHPLLKTSIFKNRVFTISILSILIINLGTTSITFLLSLYFQYLKLFSPETAGIILILNPLSVAVLSPFAGRISDKIDTRIIASIGMTITTIGLFLFTFLNENTPLEFIIFSLILVGTGLALFSSPATNAAMNSVGKKIYGTASATVSTMVFTGQVLSMGIVILIFDIYLGNAQIIPQYYPLFLKSANIAFIVYTIICFVAIFALILMGKDKAISLEN